MKDISAVSGRRRKSESIDISKTINFDQPARDPARIPSLPRPISKPKPREPMTGVPSKNQRIKVEQELAIASTRPIPTRPLPPSKVPHTEPQGKERPKSLSELLG